MTTKYIQAGDSIDYKNTGSDKILAGDIVTIGTHVGVAGCDIASGAVGTLHLTGVYEAPKLTTEAVAVGDVLYLNGDGEATKTKGSLTVVMGYAVAAAAEAAAVVRVRLCD